MRMAEAPALSDSDISVRHNVWIFVLSTLNPQPQTISERSSVRSQGTDVGGQVRAVTMDQSLTRPAASDPAIVPQWPPSRQTAL